MEERERFGLRDDDELIGVILVLLLVALLAFYFIRGFARQDGTLAADATPIAVIENVDEAADAEGDTGSAEVADPNAGVVDVDAETGATGVVGAGAAEGDSSAESDSPPAVAQSAPSLELPGDRFQFGSVQFSGKGDANTDVSIEVDGASIGETRVSRDGVWSYTSAVGAIGSGAHSAIARSGEFSSEAVAFSVDAPAAPTLTSNYNGAVAEPGKYAVNGTGIPNWQVGVRVAENTIATVPVDANGNWTAQIEFGEPGIYELEVLAIDADGTPVEGSSTGVSRIAVTADGQVPEGFTPAGAEGGIAADGGTGTGAGEAAADGSSDDDGEAGAVDADVEGDTATDGSGDGAATDDGSADASTGEGGTDGDSAEGDAAADDSGDGAATDDGSADASTGEGGTDGDSAEGDTATDGSGDGAATDDGSADAGTGEDGADGDSTEGDTATDGSGDGAATDDGSADAGTGEGGTDGDSAEGDTAAEGAGDEATTDDGSADTGEEGQGGDSAGNLITSLQATGQHNTLLAALDATGLTATVQDSTDPLTILAPTDGAFEGLPPGALDALLANPEALQAVLTEHVVPGNAAAADVIGIANSDTPRVTNLAGNQLSVLVENETVAIGGANVTQADIPASNGVIHAIDRVLLPPNPAGTKPVIDVRGVPIFEGTDLTVVGTAQPGTTLILTLNGEEFGRMPVGAEGTFEIPGQVTDGEYEILAWSVDENGLPLAVSTPVYLIVDNS